MKVHRVCQLILMVLPALQFNIIKFTNMSESTSQLTLLRVQRQKLKCSDIKSVFADVCIEILNKLFGKVLPGRNDDCRTIENNYEGRQYNWCFPGEMRKVWQKNLLLNFSLMLFVRNCLH